ncbi:HK97-gp10 family putative phage morphogenesis protein [Bacillus pumilus]|uniref:HK97-gp10 family putative phage morphogenesis protein n=1 Tax=Bacillus pumilus TaxID=1408 RepID=UPI0021B16C77|nr:HK97-gp10 family putative phage morphogenesis protein [Bacillus pumilus]
MADMDIEGFEDLTRYFNKIGDDVEKAEKVALKAGGEVIAAHQKRNVNKSSKNQPHMVDNITVSAARESKTVSCLFRLVRIEKSLTEGDF